MATAVNQDKQDARIKIVEEHLRAENIHDLDAIMDTFGSKPSFSLNGLLLNDRESIRSMYDGFGFGEQGGFSGLKAEATQRYVGDEAITVEVVLTGKHTRDWQGVPATGREVEIPACLIFTFDREAKLASEKVYFDGALLLRQLGILG